MNAFVQDICCYQETVPGRTFENSRVITDCPLNIPPFAGSRAGNQVNQAEFTD
jgi:hypothetical protein